MARAPYSTKGSDPFVQDPFVQRLRSDHVRKGQTLRDAEAEIIHRMTRRLRLDRSVLLGAGDDCAVLSGGRGKLTLLASDMLVEGVHFRKGASLEAVGWKGMAVALSDVAAMGGVPRHAVVSMGLPKKSPHAAAQRLSLGLRRCAERFGVNWVGGDTVQSGGVVLDVAILGEVEPKHLVKRTGAQPGDLLLVTGRLGGAVRSGRHLTFTPRVAEGRALGIQTKLHAMIDLSDGLLTDCARICSASKVGAVIEADCVPRHRGVELKSALCGGEDFELLMAVARPQAGPLLRWAKQNLKSGLTCVGHVVARRSGQEQVVCVDAKGKRLSIRFGGFQHFQ